MALDTVAQMVAQARAITNDETQPYRYDDSDMLEALNAAVMESKRLRPDMWVAFTTLPSFLAVDTTPIVIDPMYRMAFVYYMCGQAQLRDEEETEDTRALAFMTWFKQELIGL